MGLIKDIFLQSFIICGKFHKKLKLFSIKVINYYLFFILYYFYINFLINSPYGLFLI